MAQIKNKFTPIQAPVKKMMTHNSFVNQSITNENIDMSNYKSMYKSVRRVPQRQEINRNCIKTTLSAVKSNCIEQEKFNHTFDESHQFITPVKKIADYSEQK